MAELNENKRSSQEGDVLNLSTDNCKVDVLNISFERATKFSLVSFAANFLKHFTPSFSALSLNSVALCLIRYCCWRPIWLNISVVCEPQKAQHVFPLRKAKRNCLCHLWTWIFIVFFIRTCSILPQLENLLEPFEPVSPPGLTPFWDTITVLPQIRFKISFLQDHISLF